MSTGAIIMMIASLTLVWGMGWIGLRPDSITKRRIIINLTALLRCGYFFTLME